MKLDDSRLQSEMVATPEVDHDNDTAAPDRQDQVRANTYSLLAALLAAPPMQPMLDMLRRIDAADDTRFGASWDMLQLAARYASVEALDDEYHDLFIGISRGEIVPYGSWYLTGFMMDRSLAYLRRDLDRLGIERQQDVCEPEDHAAALCESMAVVISSPEELGLDTQRRFFEQHMAPWMAIFFRDLQAAKSANFYRAVGRLGEQFVNLEKQYLTMLG